jgi:hypothetical protein
VRAFAFALVVVVAAGCSSPPPGMLLLAWRFADERDCFSAGASIIEARTSSSLDQKPIGSFRCSDGAGASSVTVTAVPGSGTLYVDARSGRGADLYHGELSLDAAPPGTGELRTVTLFAVAAQ